MASVFQNQRPASIVYYDVRNKLITMAELGGMHIERYASFYLEMFHNYIFNYDYNRTILACQAILDFVKGLMHSRQQMPLNFRAGCPDITSRGLMMTMAVYLQE